METRMTYEAAENGCSRTGGKQYAQRYRKDDIDERNRFIMDHIPLVINLAKKRVDQGVDLEELVQEGVLGLIKAAEKFDPERGFKFSTYATYWVRQAIDSSIHKYGDTVRKPSNYSIQLSHLMHATIQLQDELGRRPTVFELSDMTKVEADVIRQLLSLIPGTLSLDSPAGNESDSDGYTYLDTLEDRNVDDPLETTVNRQLTEDLNKTLVNLTDMERRIIDMRFGLSGGDRIPLRAAGKVLSLSSERIRQIEAIALEKLRQEYKTEYLHEYLKET